MTARRQLDRVRKAKEALTPEFHTWPHLVVWALRALLAGLALHALAVEPQFTTRPLLFFSAVFGLLMSLGFAFVPTRRPRTLKAAEVVLLLALAGHVVGHAIGLYARFAWYDTLLHFVVPLATAAVLFALSQATAWIWDWRKVGALEAAVYVFAMTLALASLWEILEFGMDQLSGTREQDDLFDTMIDLCMGALGAVVGSLGVAWAIRRRDRHGPEAIAEEPKRPRPRRARKGAAKE